MTTQADPNKIAQAVEELRRLVAENPSSPRKSLRVVTEKYDLWDDEIAEVNRLVLRSGR